MAGERLLDVSELEAPEPLVRALAAVQTLAEGEYLRLRHRMKPCHLYGYLAEQGFESETRQGELAACEVFIWRHSDERARDAAYTVASQLKPWQE